jgi:RNA polymerase sigma factor (sigma-70 family)
VNSDLIKTARPGDSCDLGGRARVSPAHAERMTELFNRYHTKLVKSLVAKTHSWEDAREIAAQAFAELLSLERPGAVNFFGAYLYRTARNLAEDRLRHRAMCDRKAPIAAYEPETASPSAEPLLVQKERFAILQRAVARLRPRCRMALILRVWDELPYDVIVARFAAHGVTLNERTVRRYVAEGMERCRTAILNAEAPQQKEGPNG